MRFGLILSLLAVAESASVPTVRQGQKRVEGVISANGDVEYVKLMGSQYVLHYFDIRGRAEPIRFLLEVVGADWEDKRYSFDVEKFQYGEDFLEARVEGTLNVSMGLVPLLEVRYPGGENSNESTSFSMGQSQAIERFIASRHGLMGKNAEEAAQVDMVSEHMRDIGAACSSLAICGYMGALTGPALGRWRNELPQGENRTQKYAKFFQEELPVFLEKLEAALPSDTPSYAVGSETSLADLKIFYFVDEAFNVAPDADVKINWPPKISSIAQRVANFDSVKKHQRARPVRPF